MFRKLFDTFKKLDKKTFRIMNYGLKFCFAICLLSVIILLTYSLALPSPFTYYIGINLFKLSLIFSIEFIICGFVVDGIKKQLI